MRSMTGYGSGRSQMPDGGQYAVEIQSVNRKQSELQINLPRDLSALEGKVRELVSSRVTRGRIVVSLTSRPHGHGADATAGAAPRVPIDTAAARAYYQAIVALQKELGLSGEIAIESILRAPGVIRTAEEPAVAEETWPHVESAVRQGIEGLLAMRLREGQHLAADLQARIADLQGRVDEIRRREPEVTEHHHRVLHERLARAKVDVACDDDRLLKEIVLLASRSDVTEELTRLDSHLDQFSSLLKKDEPTGRALDFLSQEIARELNTLGAKAGDLAINQLALACKTELDKIREQIQNIE